MSWFSNWWASVTKPIPTLGKLGNLFNAYQDAYISLSQPTDETLEIQIPAHKIMLFGSQAKKQAYYDEQAKKFGWAPGTPSWYNSSSYPPEIVGDLRMRDGKLFINHLCIGHELVHTISRMNAKVMDSDEIATLK